MVEVSWKQLGALFALTFITLALTWQKPAGTRTELVVFAASSLTEGFTDVAEAFERANPGVDVRLSFAGSQVLRMQLQHGAAADVFASANEAHMKALADSHLVSHHSVGQHSVFARNDLTVIVPATNPAKINSFADLARAQRLVIGTAAVPVGIYTRDVFANARKVHGASFVDMLEGRVVSEETNVRVVRAKVALGEADAAFVYRTDALASDAVTQVPIPADILCSAKYRIAPVTQSPQPEAAGRFVAFVRSPAGQALLQKRGFVAVSP